MYNKKQRILSILLLFAMLLSLITNTVFASSETVNLGHIESYDSDTTTDVDNDTDTNLTDDNTDNELTTSDTDKNNNLIDNIENENEIFDNNSKDKLDNNFYESKEDIVLEDIVIKDVTENNNVSSKSEDITDNIKSEGVFVDENNNEEDLTGATKRRRMLRMAPVSNDFTPVPIWGVVRKNTNVRRYSSTNLGGGTVIHTAVKDDIYEGHIEKNQFVTYHNNEKVTLALSNVNIDTSRIEVKYLVGGSNIRTSKSSANKDNIIGYAQRNHVLGGWYDGTWFKTYYNGKQAYIGQSRLSDYQSNLSQVDLVEKKNSEYAVGLSYKNNTLKPNSPFTYNLYFDTLKDLNNYGAIILSPIQIIDNMSANKSAFTNVSIPSNMTNLVSSLSSKDKPSGYVDRGSRSPILIKNKGTGTKIDLSGSAHMGIYSSPKHSRAMMKMYIDIYDKNGKLVKSDIITNENTVHRINESDAANIKGVMYEGDTKGVVNIPGSVNNEVWINPNISNVSGNRISNGEITLFPELKYSLSDLKDSNIANNIAYIIYNVKQSNNIGNYKLTSKSEEIGWTQKADGTFEIRIDYTNINKIRKYFPEFLTLKARDIRVGSHALSESSVPLYLEPVGIIKNENKFFTNKSEIIYSHGDMYNIETNGAMWYPYELSLLVPDKPIGLFSKTSEQRGNNAFITNAVNSKDKTQTPFLYSEASFLAKDNARLSWSLRYAKVQDVPSLNVDSYFKSANSVVVGDKVLDDRFYISNPYTMPTSSTLHFYSKMALGIDKDLQNNADDKAKIYNAFLNMVNGYDKDSIYTSNIDNNIKNKAYISIKYNMKNQSGTTIKNQTVQLTPKLDKILQLETQLNNNKNKYSESDYKIIREVLDDFILKEFNITKENNPFNVDSQLGSNKVNVSNVEFEIIYDYNGFIKDLNTYHGTSSKSLLQSDIRKIEKLFGNISKTTDNKYSYKRDPNIANLLISNYNTENKSQIIFNVYTSLKPSYYASFKQNTFDSTRYTVTNEGYMKVNNNKQNIINLKDNQVQKLAITQIATTPEWLINASNDIVITPDRFNADISKDDVTVRIASNLSVTAIKSMLAGNEDITTGYTTINNSYVDRVLRVEKVYIDSGHITIMNDKVKDNKIKEGTKYYYYEANEDNIDIRVQNNNFFLDNVGIDMMYSIKDEYKNIIFFDTKDKINKNNIIVGTNSSKVFDGDTSRKVLTHRVNLINNYAEGFMFNKSIVEPDNFYDETTYYINMYNNLHDIRKDIEIYDILPFKGDNNISIENFNITSSLKRDSDIREYVTSVEVPDGWKKEFAIINNVSNKTITQEDLNKLSWSASIPSLSTLKKYKDGNVILRAKPINSNYQMLKGDSIYITIKTKIDTDEYLQSGLTKYNNKNTAILYNNRDNVKQLLLSNRVEHEHGVVLPIKKLEVAKQNNQYLLANQGIVNNTVNIDDIFNAYKNNSLNNKKYLSIKDTDIRLYKKADFNGANTSSTSHIDKFEYNKELDSYITKYPFNNKETYIAYEYKPANNYLKLKDKLSYIEFTVDTEKQTVNIKYPDYNFNVDNKNMSSPIPMFNEYSSSNEFGFNKVLENLPGYEIENIENVIKEDEFDFTLVNNRTGKTYNLDSKIENGLLMFYGKDIDNMLDDEFTLKETNKSFLINAKDRKVVFNKNLKNSNNILLETGLANAKNNKIVNTIKHVALTDFTFRKIDKETGRPMKNVKFTLKPNFNFPQSLIDNYGGYLKTEYVAISDDDGYVEFKNIPILKNTNKYNNAEAELMASTRVPIPKLNGNAYKLTEIFNDNVYNGNEGYSIDYDSLYKLEDEINKITSINGVDDIIKDKDNNITNKHTIKLMEEGMYKIIRNKDIDNFILNNTDDRFIYTLYKYWDEEPKDIDYVIVDVYDGYNDELIDTVKITKENGWKQDFKLTPDQAYSRPEYIERDVEGYEFVEVLEPRQGTVEVYNKKEITNTNITINKTWVNINPAHNKITVDIISKENNNIIQTVDILKKDNWTKTITLNKDILDKGIEIKEKPLYGFESKVIYKDLTNIVIENTWVKENNTVLPDTGKDAMLFLTISIFITYVYVTKKKKI